MPENALPEYSSRCGRVKNVSGPTSLCHWMSQVSPVSDSTVPPSTKLAAVIPRRTALLVAATGAPDAVRSMFGPLSLHQQWKNDVVDAARVAQRDGHLPR